MRNTSTIRFMAGVALAFFFFAGSANALPIYKANYVRTYGPSPVGTAYVELNVDSLSFIDPDGNAIFDWSGSLFQATVDEVIIATLRDTSINASVPIIMRDGATPAMQLGIDGLLADAAGDAAQFYYDTVADNRWEASAPIYATGYDLGTAEWTASGDSILLALESVTAATFDAAGFNFVPPVTMDGVTIGEFGGGYRIDFAVAGEDPGFLSILAVDGEAFYFTNAILVDGTTAANGVVLGDGGLIFAGDANTRINPNASEGLDIPGTLNVDNLLRISGNQATDGLSIDGSILLDGTRALKNVTTGSFGAGSAASPAVSFGSDPDTGFFSAAANTFAVSTAGAEKLRIADTSSGPTVLIGGTTSASGGIKTGIESQLLDVAASAIGALIYSTATTANNASERTSLRTTATETAEIGGGGSTAFVTRHGVSSTVSSTGAMNVSAAGQRDIYAVRGAATNTGADTSAATSRSTYGGHFTAAGSTAGTATAYGIYATASGADTNWAGYFNAGQVGAPSGTAAAPSYSFTTDPDTGPYRAAANTIGFSAGGAVAATLSPTALTSSVSLVIPTATPASASATGTAGTIAWDADFIYVCTATDTWERAPLSSW